MPNPELPRWTSTISSSKRFHPSPASSPFSFLSLFITTARPIADHPFEQTPHLLPQTRSPFCLIAPTSRFSVLYHFIFCSTSLCIYRSTHSLQSKVKVNFNRSSLSPQLGDTPPDLLHRIHLTHRPSLARSCPTDSVQTRLMILQISRIPLLLSPKFSLVLLRSRIHRRRVPRLLVELLLLLLKWRGIRLRLLSVIAWIDGVVVRCLVRSGRWWSVERELRLGIEIRFGRRIVGRLVRRWWEDVGVVSSRVGLLWCVIRRRRWRKKTKRILLRRRLSTRLLILILLLIRLLKLLTTSISFPPSPHPLPITIRHPIPIRKLRRSRDSQSCSSPATKSAGGG